MPTRLEGDRVLVNNRWVHGDGSNLGFLRTDGNWDMYVSNGGQMWTANYGWLHNHFFSTISNCATGGGGSQNIPNCVENCTYFGDNAGSVITQQIVDEGSNIRLRSVRHFVNCNCACK